MVKRDVSVETFHGHLPMKAGDERRDGDAREATRSVPAPAPSAVAPSRPHTSYSHRQYEMGRIVLTSFLGNSSRCLLGGFFDTQRRGVDGHAARRKPGRLSAQRAPGRDATAACRAGTPAVAGSNPAGLEPVCRRVPRNVRGLPNWTTNGRRCDLSSPPVAMQNPAFSICAPKQLDHHPHVVAEATLVELRGHFSGSELGIRFSSHRCLWFRGRGVVRTHVAVRFGRRLAGLSRSRAREPQTLRTHADMRRAA